MEINSPNPHLLVNQTYVPTPIEWQYVNNPSLMLGPWMLGALFDFMFAGILLQQFHFYRTNFKDDALWVKIVVWVTMLFATMKTVQAFLIVWFKLIVAYGDWREAANWPWQDWTEPILGASLGAAAQTYFSMRCYRLSGRRMWLLVGLFTFMLISWGCSFGVGLQIGLQNPYAHGDVPYAVIPMLVSTILVDSVITLVTMFYLIRSKKGFNHQTDSILSRLMTVTLEAALPPALSAICDVITSVTEIGNVHATFNMLTPRLYAYSLMFTLNARVVTRELAASGGDHISVHVSGFDDAPKQTQLVIGGRAKSWFPPNPLKNQVHVENETSTQQHRLSGRQTNTITLSSYEARDRAISKDDSVSVISTAWSLESKVYEMDSLGGERRDESFNKEPPSDSTRP
ncbi:hypothetical protein BDV93DRAFT_603599 [Ceratobasidium sp. AG-I]|nr:hypothetical protein BDV93DRAFT_603599 [Ceratobasidium sp. AG-I]